MRRILVVDGSRVVRATLARHLKGEFDVREEENGESAWQTLVLDSSIVAVIAAAHLTRLNADSLLQRMRSNCLQRMKDLPFLLIVSDTDERLETSPQEAHGPNGFISKLMKQHEILERLESLLEKPAGKDAPAKPASTDKNPAIVKLSPAGERKLLSSEEIGLRMSAALDGVQEKGNSVCALVFGIDKLDALTGEFGHEVASQIGSRLAGLLVAKIGPDDCIGQYPGNRLAIVSRGADLQQCAHFARRVCASLASGQIVIRGKQVHVTASAGIASAVTDHISEGRHLLALAEERLQQAFCCGGNLVIIENRENCPLHDAERMLPLIFESLGASSRKVLAPKIGALGLHLLPFLKIMDQELSLGLPLLEIKHQLQRRASAEHETLSKKSGEPAPLIRVLP